MIIAAFILHFIGDFLFQTRYIANNKSTKIEALLLHGLIYTATMAVLMFFGITLRYVVLIGMSHLITDAITSQATTYYYKKENWYMFFSVIGFDQLLHTIQILYFLTYFKG